MAEKRASKIFFTGKDNIQYEIWSFPGFNIINPDVLTCGSSKYAARYDHTHYTKDLKVSQNHRFITDSMWDKLDQLYTREQIDQEISDNILSLQFQEPVKTFADLATTYPDAQDGYAAQVLADSEVGGVLKQAGVYRYHNNDQHPTGIPTGWYLIMTSSVPLASVDIDGLLSKNDYAYIQKLKGYGMEGFAGSGGNYGNANTVARSDHRHDGTYLRIDGYATNQKVSSNIELVDGKGLIDASGNSLIYFQSSANYLGRMLGNTFIRSAANDLVHYRGSSSAAYKIWDAYNLTQEMIDKWNSMAPASELEKYLKIDGTRAMTGNLNMNSHAINSCTELNFSSDRRLKQNIVQLNSLKDDRILFDNLKKVKASTFQFISLPDHDKIGYIAEEVKEVLPQFVFENKKTGKHMVDYISLHAGKIALLEFEINSLKEEIKNLREVVSELRNLINHLTM